MSVDSMQLDWPQLGHVEHDVSPDEAWGAANIIPQLLHLKLAEVEEAVGVSFSLGRFSHLPI